MRLGHLEHVEHLGGRPHLGDVVDVGEHGEARDVLHAAQDAQAFHPIHLFGEVRQQFAFSRGDRVHADAVVGDRCEGLGEREVVLDAEPEPGAGPDAVLVVDAFATPEAARELLAEIRRRT